MIVNVLALIFIAVQAPVPDTETTRLRARATWIHPVIRTDSREYDAGMFSSTLNLHDDAGVADRAWTGGLEFETGPWRIAAAATRIEGRKTLESPLIFEEHEFAAGRRLRTTFESGWIDAAYRFDCNGDASDALDLGLLAGISATKFRFEFDGGGQVAREGHSALWPVPAFGADARASLGEGFDLRARIFFTRLSITNPVHFDGSSHPRLVFAFARAGVDVEWKAGGGWSLGIGLSRFTHYLRDTSAEDRHRVWFDSGGLSFQAGLEF
jgi:hypothetical protein